MHIYWKFRRKRTAIQKTAFEDESTHN